MNTSFSPYTPRPIRFLELWKPLGWQIKVYGIAYNRPAPEPSLVGKAKEIAASRLAAIPPGLQHYSVGFLGVHQGKTGDFVFIDWWADENELHHHVYVAAGPGRDFSYVTPSGLSACVWDLRVIGFERDAWVKRVLA